MPERLRRQAPGITMLCRGNAQAMFDQMVDWVNGQSDLIGRVLRQAAS